MERLRRRISLDEARRALYVDFEGTAVDPPSLLGVAWRDDAGVVHFEQHVLEQALWPAVDHSSTADPSTGDDRVEYSVHRSLWDDLAQLRALAKDEDRMLIAWSSHEREELRTRMPSETHRLWFDANVTNGIPIAKRWKRGAHPDVVFPPSAPGRPTGPNRLDEYLRLIGYTVPTAFGPGNSAKRIRDVRAGLTKRDGDYSKLTAVMKAKWTKALKHNWHDCNGLRELMIRCAK